MQTRSSRSARARTAGRLLVTGVVATLALAACGTATAPRPGQTSPGPGPLRTVTDQPVESDGALRCPASIDSADLTEPVAVPQKPQGVDGTARLLPDRDPTSLVVCAYPVADIMATTPLSAPFRLAKRSVANEAQRAALVEAMTWSPRVAGGPRVCTMMAGNETAYVVGAAYGDAIVWVGALADANACSTSTNGDFRSGPGPAVLLDQTFGRRTSTPPESVAACNRLSWGRLGDDQSLAPEGDPRVTVCRDAADGTVRSTALDAARSKEVTAALRALPTTVTDQTCEAAGASGALGCGGTTTPSDDTEPFGSGPGMRGLHCSTSATSESASSDSRFEPSTAGVQSGSTLTRTSGPAAYASRSLNRPSLALPDPSQVWSVTVVGRARSACLLYTSPSPRDS